MEVLYHGIKTRYAYDFPLCFLHELLMSLRNIIYIYYILYNSKLYLFELQLDWLNKMGTDVSSGLFPKLHGRADGVFAKLHHN